MAKIAWTKDSIEFFLEYAHMTKAQRAVFDTRLAEMTRTEAALKLHISERTYDYRVAEIKEKYDILQQRYPDQLPKRYVSEKEKYMDNN